MEKGAGYSRFSEFTHAGIVVRDLDKTLEFLSSFGLGPFESPHIAPLKPANYKTKNSRTTIGGVALELFQPLEGKSPWQKFLDNKGDGIHHIGFNVDDIDKELPRLVKLGARVLLSGKWEGGGFAYLQLDALGGIVFEVSQNWR